MVNNLGIGISIMFYGFLSLLSYLGSLEISDRKSFTLTLILFGLITIVTAMNKIKRSSLFLVSMALNVGMILLVIENFEILNIYNIILSSILFLLGSGFFVLFLENHSEKTLLYASFFFLSLSFISMLFYKENFIIQFANRVTLILLDFWPVFLIIFGIVLVAGRRITNRTS